MDLNSPPGTENQMTQDPNDADAFADPRQEHLHNNYYHGTNKNFTYGYSHPGVNNNHNHNSHYNHPPNHNYQRPPDIDVGTGLTNFECQINFERQANFECQTHFQCQANFECQTHFQRQANFERQMNPPCPLISPEFTPTLSSSTSASFPTASNVPVDSSATRKRNQTRKEIDSAEALAAAKRTARNIKAAHRRAEALRKQADRAAQKAATATTPRFIWTDVQTVELLQFVQLVKDDFDELEERTPGFLVWTTFFTKNTVDREEYPLLVGMANDRILRRYQALMTTWKVVYNKLSHSGSAGLHEVLTQEKLAESAWNMLNNMHQTNPGAHAYVRTPSSPSLSVGKALEKELNRSCGEDSSTKVYMYFSLDRREEISPKYLQLRERERRGNVKRRKSGLTAYGHTELNERIEELVDDLGDQSDSADDEEAARPTPRRRQGEAGLTAAELALDDDVDAALPSGEVDIPTSRPSLANPEISQASSSTPTWAARPNHAGAPAPPANSSGTQATPTNAVGPDTRPPKGVDAPSCRRGRTKQVRPDDLASSALLMMMHKSQERQEQQRLNKRALSVRAGSRKTGQIGDREERARERADERRAREEYQKEERREAQQLRTQEADRAEAAQERMRADRLADDATQRADEESCRVFQTAMMKLLAGMTK
ncbi:hypothetical protein Pst134EA_002944 [Puccinia striiformis f. sp. tritici]|uniref:hypothetical protein n=1 Tax=Puccinia striiformis f. sp. tritici TaxID=168172 RepID=UPI002008BF07|nr:hypothetical protein Pst134EA_002944 [Puccinia striiformis f. sp. tritici]KAH9472321.1 hypothetical protein Pst134EA_002944 [Puccinia striiformis f. sp. tritici]